MGNITGLELIIPVDTEMLLRVAQTDLSVLHLMDLFLHLISDQHVNVYQLQIIRLENSIIAPNSQLLNGALLNLLRSERVSNLRKVEVLSVLSGVLSYYGGMNISWITQKF